MKFTARLILRHGRIHFIGPGENATLKIKYLTEARLAQKVDGLGGTLSAAAVSHYFPGRVELMDAARQFAQRNQMAVEIANLKFVRLAHIENIKVIAAVQPRL